MEVYTFMHKDTKEIIRMNYFTNYDSEFGEICFLADFGAPWFAFSMNSINYILEHKKFIHPVNNSEETPTPEYINLDDYEVKRFILDENI